MNVQSCLLTLTALGACLVACSSAAVVSADEASGGVAGRGAANTGAASSATGGGGHPASGGANQAGDGGAAAAGGAGGLAGGAAAGGGGSGGAAGAGGTAGAFSTKSLSFNGAQRVECFNIDPMDKATARSVSAWAAYRACKAGAFPGLVGAQDPVSSGRGWGLMFECQSPNARIAGGLTHSLDGADGLNARGPTVPASRWYHYVLTYDGSGVAGGLTLYVNGEAATSSRSGDPLKGDAHNSTGVSFLGSVGFSNFEGWLDEVSIWDGVLTAEDVTALYAGGKPTNLGSHPSSKQLLHWFRMGESDTDGVTVDEQDSASCTRPAAVPVSNNVP